LRPLRFPQRRNREYHSLGMASSLGASRRFGWQCLRLKGLKVHESRPWCHKHQGETSARNVGNPCPARRRSMPEDETPGAQDVLASPFWQEKNKKNKPRTALFCCVTQRRMIILCRRFGTTYRFHIQGSRGSWTSRTLKMVSVRCPETSVKDYYSTLHNTPEECSSLQHHGRSLKAKKNPRSQIRYMLTLTCVTL
jgi:hypothetical protein